MARVSISELSHTHTELHQVKAGLRTLLAGEAPELGAIKAQVEQLAALLRTHIQQEDEGLFPEARRLLGEECEEVLGLEQEHRVLVISMEALTDRVAALEAGSGLAEVRADFEALDAALEAHATSEERFLDRSVTLLSPARGGGG